MDMKPLLITLTLLVSTNDRINRSPIQHLRTMPVVVQHSQLLGLPEGLLDLSDRVS